MQSYWVAVTSLKRPSAVALVEDREGRSFLAVLYVMGTPESLLVCWSTQWWAQCSWCCLSLVSAPFCLVAFVPRDLQQAFCSLPPSPSFPPSFSVPEFLPYGTDWPEVGGLPYFSLLTAITVKWNKEDSAVHKRGVQLRGRNSGNNKIEILHMNNWVNQTKSDLNTKPHW